MNTWSPASWQQIRRRVFELTDVRLSFDNIEEFVDSHCLWESSPEDITAYLVEAILE